MTQKEVAEFLKDGKKRTIKEISEGINGNYKSVWTSLKIMYMRGEVQREWDAEKKRFLYFMKDKTTRIEDLKMGLI